jgi:hypothetical protein
MGSRANTERNEYGRNDHNLKVPFRVGLRLQFLGDELKVADAELLQKKRTSRETAKKRGVFETLGETAK